jgi:hypothetical protein
VRTVELLGDDELHRHRHPTNRPHLTLASAERFPPAAIAGALCLLPLPAGWTGCISSAGPGVLAWAVDSGGALRELQAQVWTARVAIRTMNRACGRRTSAWPGGCGRPGGAGRSGVGEVVAGGTLSGARSHDSETRTVIPVRG